MNIDRNLRTRLLFALPIAAVAFSLAACSAPSRPSVDEVADGLQQVFEEQGQSDILTEDVMACLAEALVESELSNETLNYIANGEDRQKNIEERDLTTNIIKEAGPGCVAE